MKNLPEWLKLLKGDMNSDDDEAVDLLMAEPVGYDPKTGQGISSRVFGQVLDSVPKNKTVNLLINTLGGDVQEGTAMHNMMKARGNVNTVVIGYAASMGAVIMQAGVKRSMMPGTLCVIHNPYGSPTGDYKAMEEAAAVFKTVRDNIVSLFADRTKMSKKKIADLMDKTTYMTPDEAVENGFADDVIKGDAMLNAIEKPDLKTVLENFRTLASSATASGSQTQPQPEKTKIMKTLTAALFAVGLLPSADLTEEAAIVTAFNSASKPFVDAKTENEKLKTENKAFKDAQKTRVEKLVTDAVVAKLIKDDEATKKRYVETGLRDELELMAAFDDLRAIQGAVKPPTPRGAPPIPAEKKGSATETETQIATLQASLVEASPSEKVVISRQLRDLRGHKDIFAAPVAAGK